MDFDVIVAGAGPAGSTTARFAAEAGLSVLLIDSRKEIGWPVQCGELLGFEDEMKKIFPKVDRTEELFDIPTAYVSREIAIIRMVSPSMRNYDINFHCFSTERRNFDKYQASLAVKNGAVLMTDTHLRGIRDANTVITSRGEFSGSVIVGADGPFSAVRKAWGLPGPRELYPAMSTSMDGEFDDEVYMYFGHVAPAGYAWIIPKNGGANVGLGADRALADRTVGSLAKQFIGDTAARFNTRPKQLIAGGWVPMSGPVGRTVSGNMLLVGDAAGHVMATNGGGIQIAMMCGRIAGRVIGRHFRSGVKLSEYETEWRKAVGDELETARRMMHYASLSFRSDMIMSALFRIAGAGGLAKVIKCRSVFAPGNWN